MSSQPRQKILPFFLPMSACPHRCVYCDQFAITGQPQAPSPLQVHRALQEFSGGSEAELAYYGGSFSCLPRLRQQEYLLAAQEALAAGRIGGIRISTRPDAVDADTCAFLRSWGVTTVELGIQSFAEPVLQSSGRGYGAEEAAEACRRVKDFGFRLGIQLMTGLPQDRDEWDRASLRQSLALRPDLLRIYPTLVLKNTELARLYQQGAYQPQSLEAAVRLCAELLAMATAAGCPVQRIGLNPSPDLEAALLAGPYHPALGGLVREALRLGQVRHLLRDVDASRPALLRFPPRELPLLYGQKRAGLLALQRNFPLLSLSAEPQLPPGTLLWEQGENKQLLAEEDFCRSWAAELERQDKAGQSHALPGNAPKDN